MFNRTAPNPRARRNHTWLPTSFCAAIFLIGICQSSLHAQLNKAAGTDVLEFRGYIRIAGEMEFSVFNKENQQSEWLRVDQELGGYKVERFDVDTNSLIIRYNDEILSLSLQASQIGRYIPPVPTEKPATPPPPRSRPATTVPGTRGNAANAPPSLPSFGTSGEERTRGSQRDSSGQPRMISGIGRRTPSPSTPSPSVPGSPPSVPGTPAIPPGDPDPGEVDPGGADEWRSTGTPPPLPPTAPPDYSPGE